MTEQIKMAPCPFCEGPPCYIVHDYVTGKEVEVDRPQNELFSEDYMAHVWCHECGAQGPTIDSCTLGLFEHMFDLSAADVVKVAVERWNNRGGAARGCYDAADAEGLNLYPGEVA